MTFRAEQLEKELRDLGFSFVLALDSKYKTPSYEYIRGKFKSFQKRFPHFFEEESGDCDDAAFQVFTDLRIAARKSRAFQGFGIAIAFIVVTIPATSQFAFDNKRSKHATTLVRCSDGEWYVYEKTQDKIYNFKEIMDYMDYSELHVAIL